MIQALDGNKPLYPDNTNIINSNFNEVDAGKEDKSNKSTDTNLGTSDALYPSQNAVKTYVDNGLSAKANLNGGNHFTGNQTIGSSSSNVNLSVYGNTYIRGNFQVSYDKGYMKTLEYNDTNGGVYGITHSLGTSTIDVNGVTYNSHSNMYQWITTGKQSKFEIWHYPVKNGSIQDYHKFLGNVYDFNTSSFKTYITDDLGIGTQNPQAKLDVRGSIALNDAILYLRAGGDSNHGIHWTADVDGPCMYGNIGVEIGDKTHKDIIKTYNGKAYLGSSSNIENSVVLYTKANTTNASTFLDGQPNNTMIVSQNTNKVYFYWKDNNGNKYQATLSGTAL